MIKHYTSKPVTIEAVQLLPENVEFLKQWAGLMHARLGDQEFFGLLTLEGAMELKLGHYIIKGNKGEFYGCHQDVFELKYQEIACS